MLLNMPTRSGGGRGPENDHVRDQLSAYMDYELPDLERAQVREHLRRCPECENELATLRATKQLLAEMAAQPAPRSFALTPDMVGRAVSGPIVVRRPGWSLAARLRLASAAFALLLVFMLSVDVLFQGAGAPALRSPQAFNPLVPSAAESQMTGPSAGNDAQGQDVSAPATLPTATAAAAGAGGTGPNPASTPLPDSTVAAVTGAEAVPPPQLTTDMTARAPEAETTGMPPNAGGAVDKAPPPEAGDTFRATTPGAPPASQPAVGLALDPWRLAQITALVLALALAVGSLWAARRQA
jgi:hypothetical protein